MRRRPQGADPVERGLYTDRATGPHGEAGIDLVDRWGHTIVRVIVARPEDVGPVKRALAGLLYEIDPPARSRLELVE